MGEFNVTFVEVGLIDRHGRDHDNEVDGTCGQDETSIKHGRIKPGSRGLEQQMLTTELQPQASNNIWYSNESEKE